MHRDPAIGSHVSSCSGTLIAPDLFLTARHCLNDPSGEDVRSASVTFDYATDCDGNQAGWSRHQVLQGYRGSGLRRPSDRLSAAGGDGLGDRAARRRAGSAAGAA